MERNAVLRTPSASESAPRAAHMPLDANSPWCFLPVRPGQGLLAAAYNRRRCRVHDARFSNKRRPLAVLAELPTAWAASFGFYVL